jgi:hypothetical protein
MPLFMLRVNRNLHKIDINHYVAQLQNYGSITVHIYIPDWKRCFVLPKSFENK